MSQLGIGIVGTGMIAGVVADAVEKSRNAKLVAVSDRLFETAQNLASQREGVVAEPDCSALLARTDVQAVYIATPTAVKEDLTLAALAAGKHVLVEKPFLSRASVERMCEVAAEKKLLIMDGTHFVHHPRTGMIKVGTPEKIGEPRSLHTAFHFPIPDRNNIRFDVAQEPMGALGDLGWYSMRAVVEYLRPEGRIMNVVAVAERDPDTTAVVRAQGLIAFASGEVTTFDVGFTAGTVLMDLQLLGTIGVIAIDDFVVDWANSWVFKRAECKTGFTHRAGMATRTETTFVATPSTMMQHVIMVERFAELATYRDNREMDRYAEATLQTQEYLDAVWLATNPKCAV